jgi:hypothetical protein
MGIPFTDETVTNCDNSGGYMFSLRGVFLRKTNIPILFFMTFSFGMGISKLRNKKKNLTKTGTALSTLAMNHNFNKLPFISQVSKHYHKIDPEVRFLGIALCWMQVFDGVLTAIGVEQWGIRSEGNPLLRSAMNELGHSTALLIAKLIAILLVIFVCFYATRFGWIKKALVLVNGIYLYVAVLPWLIVLM